MHTAYAALYRSASSFASSRTEIFRQDVSAPSYTQFVVCIRVQILALPRWRPCMGGYTKLIAFVLLCQI